MSLVPAFEIGVWNAWILMAAWVFFQFAPLEWPIFRYDLKGSLKRSAVSPPYNKTEKIVNIFASGTPVLLIIYSIFLPLPLGTPWFYAGLSMFILGLIVSKTATVAWTTTPVDKPVTRGIYRYSRHPLYLAMFLELTGVGIASASWLFLLLSIISIIGTIMLIIPEERLCLEKYGDAYREYMNRTPRWIGVPKS